MNPAMTSGRDGADVPDEIADDLVAPPLLDRLLEAERVAEVDRAREVLLRAVEPVNGEQLLGAQHAERLEDLRPDLVLAAVAARRGHEHRPHALAVAHHREKRVVLVVGMRGRFHERPDRAQLAQHEAERGFGRKLADRLHPQLRRQRTVQTEQEEKDMQRCGRIGRTGLRRLTNCINYLPCTCNRRSGDFRSLFFSRTKLLNS